MSPATYRRALALPEDGGPALDAQLNNPIGVALDLAGNILIADALYHRIRRVTPGGTITTIAGNGIPSFLGDGGPATAASLQYPTGVAVDHDGNLFIADAANHRIRRIDPAGTITTVAGTGAAGFAGDGGPAPEAQLHKPTGVAVSRKGEALRSPTSTTTASAAWAPTGRSAPSRAPPSSRPTTTDSCRATSAATAGPPPRRS